MIVYFKLPLQMLNYLLIQLLKIILKEIKKDKKIKTEKEK